MATRCFGAHATRTIRVLGGTYFPAVGRIARGRVGRIASRYRRLRSVSCVGARAGYARLIARRARVWRCLRSWSLHAKSQRPYITLASSPQAQGRPKVRLLVDTMGELALASRRRATSMHVAACTHRPAWQPSSEVALRRKAKAWAKERPSFCIWPRKRRRSRCPHLRPTVTRFPSRKQADR